MLVARPAEGHNPGITIRIHGKRARRRAMEALVTDTLVPVKAYQQFIGGQWVDSASGETLDVENPATGEVVATVPASGAADVDRAVNAAATAFEFVVADHPADPQPRAAQDRRYPRCQCRRARAARVEPDGQADRRRD